MKTCRCLAGHLRYVKEHVLSSLPRCVRVAMLREQEMLFAVGYPRDRVDAYAKRELDAVRRFCTPEVIEHVEANHERLELGHAEAIAG